MKITLCSIDESLADAWRDHCGEIDCVDVYVGNILDLRVDAVISPSNSFGFMDGGIDMIYSNYFGVGVQERLQSKIKEVHNGELIVGNAEFVDTGKDNIPYLIAAPTMRVPMILSETVNPYLAARAALLLARNLDMESVAFPGLGTGVGEVEPDICALQVRKAIDEVILGQNPFPISWAQAQVRHQLMYGDDYRDLQYS